LRSAVTEPESPAAGLDTEIAPLFAKGGMTENTGEAAQT
jgi:hypothetical protein